jgi:hypothetical protein
MYSDADDVVTKSYCFGLFKTTRRVTKLDGSTFDPMTVMQQTPDHNLIRRVSKTTIHNSRQQKKEKSAYRPAVLAAENDEWLVNLRRNLRQVETECSYAWASDLIGFISTGQENFVISKFMSEMFNMKFMLG